MRNRIPINKTAALVVSSGTSFDHDLNDAAKLLYWDAPKLMVAFDQPMENLTGFKVGRFTVIGFLGSKLWQVRCSCGLYASRKRKAIVNPKNDHDACVECRNVASIKRSYDYHKTGKNKDLIEYM